MIAKRYKLSSLQKHFIHCTVLVGLISFLIYQKIQQTNKIDKTNDIKHYTTIFFLTLVAIKTFIFLALPQTLFNFIGLIFYNTFNKKVNLESSPLLLPFICVRIVTRGDYPELVQSNVERNLNICYEAGLQNFILEVVSDRTLNLKSHPKVYEIVVPSNYRTKNGSLYKARALQYCWDANVSIVSGSDWIIHLDEETLLTNNCIYGILKFIKNGQYQFGQGVITYGNDKIVNLFATFMDNLRVSEDLGKIRFQFKAFNRPLFSWKGSYIVSQASAEKHVSFDNGPKESIAEDMFFGLKAMQLGYLFNFIDGEMWEKSPFTILDILRQRKRWFIGIFYVIISNKLKFFTKFFAIISFMAWTVVPIIMLLELCYFNVYLLPSPYNYIIDIVNCFIGSCIFYMYIFGGVKTFSLSNIHNYFELLKIIFFSIILMPFFALLENLAVCWSIYELMFDKKHGFYVVKKNVRNEQIVV